MSPFLRHCVVGNKETPLLGSFFLRDVLRNLHAPRNRRAMYVRLIWHEEITLNLRELLEAGALKLGVSPI